MSAMFAVDTARIAEASGDIQRISAQIESDVRAMMARLHGLQDCWRGGAAGNFTAVTEQWSATQEQVRTTLQQISVALKTAGEDYDLVEQANRMRFTAQ
jgi:WXG100 family type VII secretion target